MKISSIAGSVVPPNDDQKWPKRVKAKLSLLPIKQITLDGFLLPIYVRGNNVSLVCTYKKCKTSVVPDFVLQIMPYLS
jgi:hypothetical protein